MLLLLSFYGPVKHCYGRKNQRKIYNSYDQDMAKAGVFFERICKELFIAKHFNNSVI